MRSPRCSVCDRLVSTGAQVIAAIPEFVIAALLVAVLAVWLEAFPRVSLVPLGGTPLARARTLESCHDPVATATRLARARLADQYMVYETEGGVWHFAAGSAVSVSAHANGITARAAGRTWTADTDGPPLTALAAALSALRDTGGTGRHFYGWAAFELAHLLHADAEATVTTPCCTSWSRPSR
ncbi:MULTISPECIES: hypothetical protein [unclassified Streptomyces]|uniref:hypothetical protein n=1 Tax=unclassified Streptomyces TaxID=2593676 RepID=UPI00081B42FE|nr:MULTISPECIES: hypothetical protein [unclassified Streptomyces]SCE28512.1 hypothetical protein GA0115247_130569 [Streptomyces sp. PalvLS-984]SDB94514.1 hypothetical protein F558DRAFT_00671 [Streptomyces sp. AmelKG-A3]